MSRSLKVTVSETNAKRSIAMKAAQLQLVWQGVTNNYRAFLVIEKGVSFALPLAIERKWGGFYVETLTAYNTLKEAANASLTNWLDKGNGAMLLKRLERAA